MQEEKTSNVTNIAEAQKPDDVGQSLRQAIGSLQRRAAFSEQENRMLYERMETLIQIIVWLLEKKIPSLTDSQESGVMRIPLSELTAIEKGHTIKVASLPADDADPEGWVLLKTMSQEEAIKDAAEEQQKLSDEKKED